MMIDMKLTAPAGWAELELLDESVRRGLPEPISLAMATAAAETPEGQLLSARVLYAPAPGDSMVIVGVVTALVATPATPLAESRLDAFQGATVSAVTLPSGSGLKVRSTREMTDLGVSLLVVQYLVQTPQGVLVLSFTNHQEVVPEMFEQLFNQLAEGVELSPRNQPV